MWNTRINSHLMVIGVGLAMLLPTTGAWAKDNVVDEGGVLTFAIVPQQSASKLAKKWGPVLRYLSEKTGYKLKFKTARDIPVFEQRLAGAEYDFAYMNPYHYTVFHDSSSYQAVAKAKDKEIKGIMVVKKDSPIKTLDDLAGKQLALPSPAAFAASILTRAELTRRGISFEPKYVSSHDSVYRNVARGRMSVGGGVGRTFKNTDAEVRESLRVLWTTKGYTPHAIAAHSRVPREIVTKVRKALIEMHKTPEGLALIAGLNLKGFVPAADEDWDDVRSLGITLIK